MKRKPFLYVMDQGNQEMVENRKAAIVQTQAGQ